MNKFRLKFLISILLLLCFMSTDAYSRSTGIADRAESNKDGCFSCHGSANGATTLNITSSTGFVVKPNSITNFKITIKNSSQVSAGINIQAKTAENGGSNIGTLTAGTGTKILSNELVHSSPQTLSNGEYEFDFTWQAPSTTGDYFILAVGNAVNGNGSSDSGDQWDRMTPQKITVSDINITAPNGGEDYCAGSTQVISWENTNVENLKIELSSDGGATYDNVLVASVPGSDTQWNWSIPPGQTSGSNYKIKLTDIINSNINDESLSSFNIGASTSITTQPLSQSVCSGDNVGLVVEAVGMDLNYQWRKNGNDIAGAINSTYSIIDVLTTDAGEYTCVVTSVCGNPIESTIASITVNPSPQITSFPIVKNLCVGDPYTISAEISGTGYTYLWYLNGAPIGAGDGDSFTISNATNEDDGKYKLDVISENCGTTTSSDFTLNIIKPIVITKQPEDKEVCENEELVLSLEASGTNNLYTWKLDGVELATTNEPLYIIDNTELSHGGNYTCEINNQCSQDIVSNEFNVKVNPIPRFIKNLPSEYSVKKSFTLTINLEANDNSVSWDWYKDDTLIQTNGPTLMIQGITEEFAGEYYCIITNDCGSTKSNVMALTVISGTGAIFNASGINFGNVILNENKSADLVINNTGDEDLIISDIKLIGADKDVFSFDNPSLPLTITPESMDSIKFYFTPSEKRQFLGQVDFTSNVADKIINLSGSGVEALASVNSSSSEIIIKTNRTDKNTIEFQLINNSDVDAIIRSFDIDSNQVFDIINPAFPFVLIEQSSESLTLEFNPNNVNIEEDMVNTILTINIDNGDDISIDLVGIIEPNSVNELSFLESRIFPNPANQSINIEFVVENNMNLEAMIYDSKGTQIRNMGMYYSNSGLIKIEWDGLDNSGLEVKNGVYFIYVNGDDGTKTFKLIINK